MFKTAVASVSFRPYKAEEILKAAKKSGIEAIEWGSDVHAPVDDTEVLKKIRDLSKDFGVEVSSYGSYYRLGKDNPEVIKAYINAARILGTDCIRIWCAEKASAEISEAELKKLIGDGRIISEIAKKNNITLCLECHPFTLTDDYKSSLNFIEAVGNPNLKMYWQPNQFKSEEYNLLSARALAPVTENLHVFHWDSEYKKYPLCEGTYIWEKYLSFFKEKDHNLILEFMHDDKLETLKSTAETLRDFIKSSQRN